MSGQGRRWDPLKIHNISSCDKCTQNRKQLAAPPDGDGEVDTIKD